MAELRVGHDQVVFPILYPIRLNKGKIWFTASGFGDPAKVKKLTGTQPLVLVGDDGEIIATWHNDLTENFAVARNHPDAHIHFQQEWQVLSIQNI